MTFLISFFNDWPSGLPTSPRFSRPRPDSAPEIGDCEIEHLASSATDDGLDHVEGEPLGHLKGDLGRDREFLPIHDGIDKHRPVMSEGGRDPRLHVCRVLDPNPSDTRGLSHGREIRVLELSAKIQEAGRSLLEFYES